MLVRLKRDTGWADRLRAYKVVVDGELIGKIKQGDTKCFDVPDTAQSLVLKIDWCRSNEVRINLDEPELDFTCGSSLRGFKLFLALLYITFRKNQYLWLKPLFNTEEVPKS